MQLLSAAILLMAAGNAEASPISINEEYVRHSSNHSVEDSDKIISPKAFVLSTFTDEAAPWHKYQNLTRNFTLPGLSPLFPNVTCTNNTDLCQLTVGEGPANSAASVTALLLSPKFNLTNTYFLIAGVGGIDPSFGGLGSAAFARYAVSVGSMYEVDAREKPKNWSTGYWAYGTQEPGKPATSFYGNEVFEVNENLRDYAYGLALNVTLKSTADSNKTDLLYNISAARSGPKVLACDVSTSEIYPTGELLGKAASNITSTFTNGTGKYCLTAQEDTSILEAALRGAKYGLTDYSRWVILRTAADFDRPPASLNSNPVSFLFNNNTGGFSIAQENLYRAGYPFIKNVINQWNKTFLDGTNIVNGSEVINGTHAVKLNSTKGGKGRNSSSPKNGTYAPDNYIGDVFGTLGGEPDFGPGSYKHHAYINTF